MKRRFDVVTTRDVLKRIPSPALFLKYIRTTLKPGGIFITQMPNQMGLCYRLVGPRHVCVFGTEHLSCWTEHSVRASFYQAGLNIKSITCLGLENDMNSIVSYFKDPSGFTTAYGFEDLRGGDITELTSEYFTLWNICRKHGGESRLLRRLWETQAIQGRMVL